MLRAPVIRNPLQASATPQRQSRCHNRVGGRQRRVARRRAGRVHFPIPARQHDAVRGGAAQLAAADRRGAECRRGRTAGGAGAQAAGRRPRPHLLPGLRAVLRQRRQLRQRVVERVAAHARRRPPEPDA